ncbi:hypothetical protein NVP1021C_37 [Vibrio phage 1.021.C._10N.222.51.F9]|nr:hypothetical protein NVP1021A_37 [Vibrio phage 1.021.A._10N.222.51.F9]AUR82150.1 hypothetical protein NVP1021B_37 [Vibrio phage 1.021.B._10N.222.51.F9]AUR82200.1 hypothetical protein NVP1021C_37 [Vibrio phage 1.021.C._10N.222.51.F9]
MSIKNPEAIISLAALMLGHTATQDRGAKLAKDLADELLPQKSEASTGEVAAAPAAPAATMTPEELNNALIVEFLRLGNREGIDNAMAEFGVTSVNDLKPEQFQPLLDKVKAI